MEPGRNWRNGADDPGTRGEGRHHQPDPRHYDRVGLVVPSRAGANGYRYYNSTAVARLQRILLMRRPGMGLPTIAEVLAEKRAGSQLSSVA
ncbi:hypothetical protein Ssi02_53740 [Sinosporangium siamense]|uniref:HTH merR-type domain-containing protein n=1 Tax=Sinosporangium siamense TaxID=1367973 RepID=A0A919RJX3_9ACTN|nr:hypothetical protein Ssi02_53740 [Sinosporangium siamense]